MAQRVILAASASDCINIPPSLPQSIHRFLNAHNATALEPDCALTSTGHNLYLPMSFFQALLQGHILAIPVTDTPTGLSPLPWMEVTG